MSKSRLASEAIGTAFLLIAVVGSGIMGEQLAGGNVGIALLANSIATGAALIALISAFGSISSHFNPVVTIMLADREGLNQRNVITLIFVQICGAVAGVAIANVMFGFAPFTPSEHMRTGPLQWTSEAVATVGLLLVIWGSSRTKGSVAVAVGCYIAAAYWFVPSTSFANPAVTIARCLTNTFSGIRPIDVPAFIFAQFAGMLVGAYLIRLLKTGHE